MVHSELSVDLNLAFQFLQTLDIEGGFTFQTFDDSPSKNPALAKIIHMPPGKSVSKELKSLNEAGAGIFITVNRTDMNGRSIKNVVALRSLFVDGDDIQMPTKWHATPNIIVHRSMTRWHAYWLLCKGEPISEFSNAQKRLAQFYGTDRRIFDLPRVMRVPGFIHKKDVPSEVFFEARSGIERRSIAALMDGLPELKIEPAPPRSALQTTNQIQDRALKYINKIPFAVSGAGGHPQTFKTACRLVIGFGLSIADAMPLLRDWSQSCQPPWTERELEHKLRDAEKQAGERGALLRNPNKEPAYTVTNTIAAPEEAVVELDAMDQLEAEIEDIISGKSFAVQWPWHYLTDLGQALVPGDMIAFCGSPGSSKSLMILQAMSHWFKQDLKVAVLMLESSATLHLKRLLAQESRISDTTKYKWINSNPEKIRAVMLEHAAYVRKFSACINSLPDAVDPTVPVVLAWLEAKAQAGARMIAIDPFTMLEFGDKIWVGDKAFIRGARKIIKKYGCSLILVTHPKGGVSGNVNENSLDDMALSQALGRFCDTAIWLSTHKIQSDLCDTSVGRIACDYNRTIQFKKTRSGSGQGRQLAYLFSSEDLCTTELGILE